MIVVRVEIWPYGDPEGAFEIGRIVGWNEGENADLSSYAGTVVQTGSDSIGVPSWAQEFQVRDLDRTEGPWRLISAILSVINLRGQS